MRGRTVLENIFCGKDAIAEYIMCYNGLQPVALQRTYRAITFPRGIFLPGQKAPTAHQRMARRPVLLRFH